MITAGEFRNGRTFEHEGNVFQIVEFQHVKPGKGAAFVRTKLKNIISGGVVEKTFRPTEKFEEAHIDRKDMAYSYGDDDFYHFMDNETFDMLDIAKDWRAVLSAPSWILHFLSCLAWQQDTIAFRPPTVHIFQILFAYFWFDYPNCITRVYKKLPACVLFHKQGVFMLYFFYKSRLKIAHSFRGALTASPPGQTGPWRLPQRPCCQTPPGRSFPSAGAERRPGLSGCRRPRRRGRHGRPLPSRR